MLRSFGVVFKGHDQEGHLLGSEYRHVETCPVGSCLAEDFLVEASQAMGRRGVGLPGEVVADDVRRLSQWWVWMGGEVGKWYPLPPKGLPVWEGKS